jgi:hypothetical protein
MKTKVLLTFCVIMIASCTNQKLKPITDAEKTAITQEVNNFFEIFDQLKRNYALATYCELKQSQNLQ